ncbi:uncharacterized protein V1510DRAFT_403691, partial [Dipodascopsis tothii]|uniref:uncharacterized protein n=1 Tax=Dipodascopsis tothii TaxID=44089 RepID=UPI0034CF015A
MFKGREDYVPYTNNEPLDDLNDTIFLAESSDEDEFGLDEDESFASRSDGIERETPPAGELLKLETTGARVYVTKPKGVDLATKGMSLLLLLTNGLGVDSVNNQLQADDFARE